MDSSEIKGLRVFVVEDVDLVAQLLQDMVERLGCETSFVADRLRDAVAHAATGDFDVALLDVMIAGEDVHPVVERLAERGIPFAFVTGHGTTHPPTGIYRDRPVIHKPVSGRELEAVLRQLAQQRSPQ